MADKQLTFFLSGSNLKSRRWNCVGNENPNWKGGLVGKICLVCETKFHVAQGRKHSARFCSLACVNIWQRRDRPNLGKTKAERIDLHCLECGKGFQVTPGFVTRIKFCCRKCHLSWRSKHTLKQGNPNWMGGTSKLPYPFVWAEVREDVKQRDGGACQNPNCWGVSALINVHHIDYNKDNCEPWNLITLCASCNGRANFDRDNWMTHYKAILEARGIKGRTVVNGDAST